MLLLACSTIITNFLDIKPPPLQPVSVSTIETVDSQTQLVKPDLVAAYSRNLFSLGMLLMEFNDSIREGDGERVIRCWRYFLPLFKLDKRTNYSLEALMLLAQHEYLFTPRQKAQLKWSRTINTHGRIGKNIIIVRLAHGTSQS